VPILQVTQPPRLVPSGIAQPWRLFYARLIYACWEDKMRTYSKQALTFDQQLDKLKHRGMIVADDPEALHMLATVSYYRLSGYWYPMRKLSSTNGERLNDFRPGTTFSKVIELYEFDRELRSLVLDAMERIEIGIRTQMTYHFGHAHGAFGHTVDTNFHHRFDHQKWLGSIETEAGRSRDQFIQHYQSTYSGFPRLPVWIATEVMSLGSLSFFYKGMLSPDKRNVSGFFNLHPRRLQNWLHVVTYVRNVCAHHSRLWNRALAISPDQIREPSWSPPITPRNDRLFYILLMVRHLLKAINPQDDWHIRVNQLVSPIAATDSYRKAMGMPEAWRTHPLWL